MNKFLQVPNGLLFILLVIIPAFFPNSEAGNYIEVVYGLLIVIWVIKVDEELYLRLKGKTRINFNVLLACLLFAFFYFSIVILFTDGYNISTEKDNYSEYGWLTYLYVPGHLIAFAGYLYGLHFTAYSISKLEDQLFGKKSDYGLLLLALFFFPIGIWWTQPKINRILRMALEEQTDRSG